MILKDRDQIAVYDGLGVRWILAQCKQTAVILINRIGIVFLACQIDLSVVAVGRKPRGTGRKACICRRIPLERSPGIITADAVYGL